MLYRVTQLCACPHLFVVQDRCVAVDTTRLHHCVDMHGTALYAGCFPNKLTPAAGQCEGPLRSGGEDTMEPVSWCIQHFWYAEARDTFARTTSGTAIHVGPIKLVRVLDRHQG